MQITSTCRLSSVVRSHISHDVLKISRFIFVLNYDIYHVARVLLQEQTVLSSVILYNHNTILVPNFSNFSGPKLYTVTCVLLR
jgi:hypothetical protein